jgi:hypothetical protein
VLLEAGRPRPFFISQQPQLAAFESEELFFNRQAAAVSG